MTDVTRSCCAAKSKPSDDHCHLHEKKRFDFIFTGSISILVLALLSHFLIPGGPVWTHHFSHTVLEILGSMWWGVAIGIVVVGVMNKVPRDFFIGVMGRGDRFSGLLRAVFAGFFLDLCCHGILLVAAKLYERGVSIAQVIAFLVASPWNSISLTLVLISLIGLKWTLLYVLGSAVIALITGYAFQIMAQKNQIPVNPNTPDLPTDFKLGRELMIQIKRIRLSPRGMMDILKTGWADGKMIIKWLLFGTLIAAALRTFVPPEMFHDWFGPTVAGLFLTVLIATILEICSEGSAPIASEFVTQAAAPGNGFAFLMAGVATDYTEILALREFTKSWKIALLLPAVTVPQVVLLGWIFNMAS